MNLTVTGRGYSVDLAIADAPDLGGVVLGGIAPADLASGARIADGGAVAATEAIANTGTEGDVAVAAPAARSDFHVDGTGIRIGILSDSFDLKGGEAADIADGALPVSGVSILSEGPAGGEDEGRAMAQLIHAIAPGAQLFFYSAFNGETDFARGIETLAQNGCSVIVDDVTYLDEPFYQDGGAVQAAVEAVVATGVSYFTSASNSGHNFYEANFTPMAAILPGGIGAVAAAQQFSNGTAQQSVTIAGGDSVSLSLQWDQPFASIGNNAGSANNLSIYLFDAAGDVVAKSDASDVGQDPVQEVDFKNTGAAADFTIAIVWDAGTVQPGLFKYIAYSGSAGAITIDDTAAGIGSGSVIGHELVADANTVGAVNATQTPAYGVSPPQLEGFSSVGPGEFLFDFNGGRLTNPLPAGKVNFTAPDGIATSVFNPFFGTSAAAPNAAAVAALALQANINLTPGQLSSVLSQTAIPMGGAATADGAGLVQADASVRAAFGDVWTGASGGNWSSGSLWASGHAPAAGDFATVADDFSAIVGSYAVVVDTATAVAETVSLAGNGTVSVQVSIGAADRLSVGGGTTVAQNATLAVAGTLLAGGVAELVDPTASLQLQAGAAMQAGVLEIGAGTVSLAAGVSVATIGGIDLILTVGSIDQSIPYGVLMGTGMLQIGAGAQLLLGGGGGVFLGGGTLAIAAGATLSDASTSGVAMLLLGGSLNDMGWLDETGHNILVNTGGSLAVGAGGSLVAADIDVQGAGSALTVSGAASVAGALTGAATCFVGVAGTLAIGAGMSGAPIQLASGSRLDLETQSSTILTSGLTSAITIAGITTAAIDLAGIAFNLNNTLSYVRRRVEHPSRCGDPGAAAFHRRALWLRAIG